MFVSLFKTFQNIENKKNINYIRFSKTFNQFGDSEKNTLSDEHFRKYIMDSSLSSLNKYNNRNNLKTPEKNIILNTLNHTLSNDKIKVDISFLFLAFASSFGFFLYYRYKP